MAFTGVFEQVGSAVNFGQTGAQVFPRCLIWDGVDLIMWDRLLYERLGRLNRTTGVVTFFASQNLLLDDLFVNGLASDGTDLWILHSRSGVNTLYRGNTSGGTPFEVATLSIAGNPTSLGIRGMVWDGTQMWAKVDANFGSGAIHFLATLNLTTGLLTRVGTADDFGITLTTDSTALAWDGEDLYTALDAKLCILDRTTGVASFVDEDIVDFGLDADNNGCAGLEVVGINLYMTTFDGGILVRAIRGPVVSVGEITTERPTDAITENTFTIAYTKADDADAEPTAAIVVTPSGNASAFSVSTPTSGSLTLTRDPMLSSTNQTFAASEVTVTLTFADGSTDDLQLRFAEAVFVQPPDAPVIQGFVQANGRVRLTWNIPALNNSVPYGFYDYADWAGDCYIYYCF